jgi:hypothetical protein
MYSSFPGNKTLLLATLQNTFVLTRLAEICCTLLPGMAPSKRHFNFSPRVQSLGRLGSGKSVFVSCWNTDMEVTIDMNG